MRAILLMTALCGMVSWSDMDVKLQLVDLYLKVIDSDRIIQAYERTTGFTADHEQLISHVADITTKEFSEAASAIRNIQKTAKESYLEHTWSKDQNNSFWDAFTNPIASTNGSFLPVTRIDRFGGNVSLSDSAVNLPIDVFPNWTDVMNTIQWTKGLNRAFTGNYQSKPANMFWQYLGTPQGILRSYPASAFEEDQQFSFDVRTRPWYNEGIGCPKDVILLIDTSGSLEGFPSKLLKTTARRMVDLILSDSDFVSAIGVGATAQYLTCNGLLQRAEVGVKDRLTGVIDALQPSGTSNWTEGIMMAFQSYKMSEEAELSAGCRRVLVIFTDETSQDLDKVMTQFDPLRNVRVYVFSFKRNEGLFQDKLSALACLYKGVYKKILYFGQIGEALQSVVQKETMHLNNKEVEPTWSNVYKDVDGFGFVLTVTLPVVVSTSDSEKLVRDIEYNNSVSFLGVVGLDFKTDAIITRASSTLPLNTALILINNKGYPIYHDRLPEYDRDVTTKLQDFQYSADNQEALRGLEEKMMQQSRFTVKTRGLFSEHAKIRGSSNIQDITFQTAKVEGTPFGLAIGFTDYPLKYRITDDTQIPLADVQRRLEAWRQNDYGILTKLNKFSCDESKLIDGLLRGSNSGFGRNDYHQVETDSYCKAKVSSIITDLWISNRFMESFLPTPDLDVRGRYVITYNGFVFFNSINKQWNTTDKSGLRVLAPFAKVMKNLNGVKFYVGLPGARNPDDPKDITLNITQRIEVEEKLVAAAGFEIGISNFRRHVLKLPVQDSDRYLNSEIYLVDENGFIVAKSPLRSKINFIGEEHPDLLDELVRRGIYTKHSHTECIKKCSKGESGNLTDPPDIASRASLPLSILLSLSKAFRTMILLLNLLWHTFLLSLAKPRNEYYNPTLDYLSSIRSIECCKEYTHYERDFTYVIKAPLKIPALCHCGASFDIEAMYETNLLSVKRNTINPHCRCTTTVASLPNEGMPKRVDRLCYNSTVQHRFRPSKTCIREVEEGEITDPECVSSSIRSSGVIHNRYFVILAMLSLLVF